MPAPANAPMLQLAWKPDISGRRAARSTVTAWVFMETSRVPWKTPQANRAANKAGSDPATPASGPARQ